MTQPDKAILAKIDARKRADEIIELAEGEAAAISDCVTGIDEFWDHLAKSIKTKLPSDPPPKPREQPMSELAADEWGRGTVLRYGRHEGERIRDVPLNDLEKMLSPNSEFKLQLWRYLESPAVKRERCLPAIDTSFDAGPEEETTLEWGT